MLSLMHRTLAALGMFEKDTRKVMKMSSTLEKKKKVSVAAVSVPEDNGLDEEEQGWEHYAVDDFEDFDLRGATRLSIIDSDSDASC